MTKENRLLVAVSGGVDSVVLLDMLVKKGDAELLVAHFDHGIREDSAVDARFVGALAERYSLPFFTAREELGAGASEDLARKQRYAFLRRVAKEQSAAIVTAHHADDVVETIAINIQRGTGWRGLAVFGAADIERPLTKCTKAELYTYALEHRLEWVEDSTNASQEYLRNKLRVALGYGISEKTRRKLRDLWHEQQLLKWKVDAECERLIDGKELLRYFFIVIDKAVAMELLRRVLLLHTGKSVLPSQLERGVLAIKTARPGTKVQLGEGIELRFSRSGFVAHQREKML